MKQGMMEPIHVVARVLGCHRSRVLRLIEEGELGGAMDLRGPGASRACIRIPRDSIVKFLESRSRSTGNGATKRAKRARIAPTKTRRHPDRARAPLTILRAS